MSDAALLGVAVPGVDGGVKAGERSEGGGSAWACDVDEGREGAEDAVDAVSSFGTAEAAAESRAARENASWSTSASAPAECGALARGE